MRDHVTGQFPRGEGPTEDVLAEFGVSRQWFGRRLREILLNNPPAVLDDADIAHVIAACS